MSFGGGKPRGSVIRGAGAGPGFNFGGGQAPGGAGFNFGGGGVQAPGGLGGAGAGVGFNFGGGATVGAAAPQLSFGGQPTGAPPAQQQLSFGGPPTSTPAQQQLSFGGVPTGTAAPQVSFGQPPTSAPAPQQLSFGGVPTGTAAPQLSFGAAPTSISGQAPQLSFGAPPTSAPAPQVSFGGPPTSAPAPQSQLSFGAPPTSAPGQAPQLSFGAPPTSAPAAPQLSFTAATPVATSAPLSVIGEGKSIAQSTTTAQSTVAQPTIGQPTLAQSVAAPPGAGAQPSTGGGTSQLPTSTQSTTASVSQINFRQLQESINKWMLDLQDQEKVFLEEATKVNAWDRTLIANGDKIAKLNESITKVKADHARLEHAVDYIKTQQQEFEMFLEPLEAGLPVNIPVEPEREQMYSLTETVDTQLQQMSEDLKEVIRHINEANKTVDKNDPVSQILRILNEHMDALHWVEDNTNQIKRSMEDVSKQHQTAKKDHERSLRMMFK